MSFRSHITRGLRYIFKGVPEIRTSANITYLSPSERLKGKNIIITGGGTGIGYAMAKRFVEEGANVLISGRTEKSLIISADQLKCKYLVLDVQNVNSFGEFYINAENLLSGPIDCLVNNAGISLHETSFLDVDSSNFDCQISTNFRGAFFMSQKFIERYKLNGLENGKILFISSETSITVDDRPYGLTKAAINSLVQGLAYRYIKEGIRVNAVAPGITASAMTGFETDGNLYIENRATNRIYLPEEVAEIACYLLSDAANCLNGQILVCNEGNTINARWK